MEQIKDKQWAKDLSLKLWRWLRDHPSCASKEDTPFYEELEGLVSSCPLCHLGLPCFSACPLTACCTVGKNKGFYRRWRHAQTIKARYRAASVIVKRLEAWDITGGKE